MVMGTSWNRDLQGFQHNWHCRCIHCIHCCTDIVVAIAAAAVWVFCCHHFVHGCCCTREVRSCSLLPAGVVPEEVAIPNEGGGGEGIDWRCHHHWSSLLLRRVSYHGEIVFSTSSSLESVGMFLHAVVGRVCCSLAVMHCLNSFDRRIFHPSVSG